MRAEQWVSRGSRLNPSFLQEVLRTIMAEIYTRITMTGLNPSFLQEVLRTPGWVDQCAELIGVSILPSSRKCFGLGLMRWSNRDKIRLNPSFLQEVLRTTWTRMGSRRARRVSILPSSRKCFGLCIPDPCRGDALRLSQSFLPPGSASDDAGTILDHVDEESLNPSFLQEVLRTGWRTSRSVRGARSQSFLPPGSASDPRPKILKCEAVLRSGSV